MGFVAGQGAWDLDALDVAWRRTSWLRPPDRPSAGVPAAEAAIVAGVAALHVVDHRVVPSRLHASLHLVVAAGAVGVALAAGATPTDMGLRADRVGRGLRHGATAAAVISGGVVGAALVPATRPMFNDIRLATATNAEVASTALLRIPLGTALYEEVVFRGVLMGLALRRTSPLGALVSTSVLFGLWHVLPTLEDHAHHPLTRDRHRLASVVGAVANTTVAGFGFGMARLASGSVVAPILAHTASNVAAYLAAATVARRRWRAVSKRRSAEGFTDDDAVGSPGATATGPAPTDPPRSAGPRSAGPRSAG